MITLPPLRLVFPEASETCRVQLIDGVMKSNPPKKASNYSVVSLFSGAGGLDLGFLKADFSTILAADHSPVAVETFNANLPPHAIVLDLGTLPPSEIVKLVLLTGDSPVGVIGGPPCQSFSRANVRQTPEDPRRGLIFNFLNIIVDLNNHFDLDFFLMENVSTLAKPKHRKHLERLKDDFRQNDFEVFEILANASDFDIPQFRPRLLLFGIKRDLVKFSDFKFPVPANPKLVTVRSAISHLGEPTLFDKTARLIKNRFHPNHWTMKPISNKFTNLNQETGRSFRRLKWDEPSPTVCYGHREIHVHPMGHRRLSILEAMILQGFPESFEIKGNLSQQVTQISNAVPPPLAKAAALAIRKAIYDKRDLLQSILEQYLITNGRHFPWRSSTNAFHLLIAEKLLQQTAVTDAVVSIYNTIVTNYPTPNELAEANPHSLAQLIKPLGLSYRAEELIRIANFLKSTHNGRVPEDRAELLCIPGVGDYIADALQTFMGWQEVAIVDTNVARFIRRIFGLVGRSPSNPSRNPRLKRIASWLIHGVHSKEINLAVLDITTEICRSKSPLCSHCPLSTICVAGKAQLTIGGTNSEQTK